MSSQSIGWRATEGSENIYELVSHFQIALRQEIEELKNGRDGQNLTVRNGKLLFSSSNQFVYCFLVDSNVTIPDDTPVEISLNNNIINGQIISTGIEGLNIAFDEKMGEIIPEITIKTSRSKLSELLISKFDKINSGELSINKEGCMKLFAFIKPERLAGDVDTSMDLERFSYTPNHDQKNAVLKSLTQEVTFLWGPPGTGKTRILSIIVDQLIRSNKKVLLTSHTNLAVDEILLKYAKSQDYNEIIEEGRVLRYGNSTTKEPLFDNFVLENIVHKKADRKYDEIQTLENTIKSFETDLIKYQNKIFLEKLRDLESSKEKKAQSDLEISKLKNIIMRSEGEIKTNLSRIYENKLEIENLKTANFIKKIFSRKSIGMLTSEIDKYKERNSKEKHKIIDLRDKLGTIERKRDVEAGNITDLEKDLEIIISSMAISVLAELSIDAVRDEINSIEKKIKSYTEKINAIREEINAIEEEVIKNALVIGCTLTKAYVDPNIFNDHFDVMILDEASMAQLPAVFFAAGLISQTHYILTGDFRQLPPIAASDGDAAKIWLSRDIFAQAGIEESENCGRVDDRLVMLRDQYRMHPSIVRLINEPMYGGKLRTAEYVSEDKAKITANSPFANNPCVIVDTSTVNPWCKRPPMGSRVNLYTAVLSVRLAKMILDGGINNIGIVTPYNAQGKLITTCLEDEGFTREKVMASTIHKFQGNERECIIFDVVDGPPYRGGILLRGSFTNSNAGKLINVAVSRAEGKFIFIGNSQYIRNEFDDNDAIVHVLEEIQNSGKIVDSRDILPSYFDMSIGEHDFPNDAKILSYDEDMTLWNEDNFYRIFIEDMKKAKERVVIFSPFIRRKRVSILMDTFRFLVDKKVSVYIITKNPMLQGTSSVDDTNDLIEEIENNGISVIIASKKVNLREKIHEKFALIDRNVFYHGSLNILSQSDSSESMLVFRSPKIIEQFIKNFDIDRIIRRYENASLNEIHSQKVDTGDKKLFKSQSSPLIKNIQKSILNLTNFDVCPGCQAQLVLKYANNDLFFGCPNSFTKACVFRKNIPRTIIEKAVELLNVPCNKCNNGHMHYKVGKYGPFLTCDQFPRCKNTANLRS